MSRDRRIVVLVNLAFAVAAAACGDSNPAQPSSSSRTASVTAPVLVTPANSATVRFGDQPITLVVQNAAVTAKATGAVTYTFEVATDAGFSAKVQTNDAVAEGTGGQTSARLDSLAGGRDYYWHVRAQGGGTTGVFGDTYRFTVGAQVVLLAPSPIAPPNGAQTVGRSILNVNNAGRQGQTGPITYQFEVAENSAFNPVTIVGLVAETPNQTSFTITQALSGNRIYYWRAAAIDASNAVTGPVSSVQNFTHSTTQQSELASQLGITLWPGTQPPGETGHAVLGPNWQVQTVRSFTGVTFVSPPFEALRIFDLLDRGMAPQSALDWLNSHGYPNVGVYYSSVDVFGLEFVYLARVNGAWELVVRVGA
jgi:hypothetical protein